MCEGFELVMMCVRWYLGALRSYAAALEKACAAIVSLSEDEDVCGCVVVCLVVLLRIVGDVGVWSVYVRCVMYVAYSAMYDAFEGVEDGEFKR